ncbi:MAG: helix-turn-helix domain-containing protein [Gammaproteobacteria bacterium]
MSNPKKTFEPNRFAAENEAPFSKGLTATPEFQRAWRDGQERRAIGRALERMRREAELTQMELAKKMDKDQAFVSRMESGRGPMPKAQHIALYAEQCGFMTAYAFLARQHNDDGLTLHELRPIAQDEESAAELEAVRNVPLYAIAVAGEG